MVITPLAGLLLGFLDFVWIKYDGAGLDRDGRRGRWRLRGGRLFARTRVIAMFLPGAILLAEAAIEATRIGRPSYGVADPLAYGILLVVLGLAVTVLIRRRHRPE